MCDFSECLYNKNCKCQKKLIHKLVAECTENIDKVKIAEITLARRENVCVCSYTICVMFAGITLAISIGIGAYFVYSRWLLKKDVTRIKFGTCIQWNCIQTTI